MKRSPIETPSEMSEVNGLNGQVTSLIMIAKINVVNDPTAIETGKSPDPVVFFVTMKDPIVMIVQIAIKRRLMNSPKVTSLA